MFHKTVYMQTEHQNHFQMLNVFFHALLWLWVIFDVSFWNKGLKTVLLYLQITQPVEIELRIFEATARIEIGTRLFKQIF